MYEEYYEEFHNEVNKILASYLFWRMLQHRSSVEKELLTALNKTPLSWTFIRHSLQVNLFIILGRFFDTNNNSFSVDDLIKCCIDEIDIFSLENLRRRKISDCNGCEPEWVDKYIANAHEPNIGDFQRLKPILNKHKKTFESIYRPIRHNIIAHNNKEYINKADELWDKTNIRELEGIIWFLNDLKETLSETFLNGRKLELKDREPDISFYEKDFGKLLDSIK